MRTANGTADAVSAAKLNNLLLSIQDSNTVVDSLRNTGDIPGNYITKGEAISLGWKQGKAIGNYLKEGQIGGDVFLNRSGVLPSSEGRVWYEADIVLKNNISRSNQAGTRLLYSNDGQLYITQDHYKTVHYLGTWK